MWSEFITQELGNELLLWCRYILAISELSQVSPGDPNSEEGKVIKNVLCYTIIHFERFIVIVSFVLCRLEWIARNWRLDVRCSGCRFRIHFTCGCNFVWLLVWYGDGCVCVCCSGAEYPTYSWKLPIIFTILAMQFLYDTFSTCIQLLAIFLLTNNIFEQWIRLATMDFLSVRCNL